MDSGFWILDSYLQNPESRIQNPQSRSLAQESSCIFTPPPPRVQNFLSPSRSSESTFGFWMLDSGLFTPHLNPPSPDIVYQSIQMDSIIPHAWLAAALSSVMAIGPIPLVHKARNTTSAQGKPSQLFAPAALGF